MHVLELTLIETAIARRLILLEAKYLGELLSKLEHFLLQQGHLCSEMTVLETELSDLFFLSEASGDQRAMS